jgi:hypothetical protein
MGRKGEAPEYGLDDDMRKCTLLLGAEGAMVERGLLPTLNYREKGGGGSVLILRIESTQLLCVPWVFDVHPCLGVMKPIRRASWDCFVDKVWAFPWWLQLRRACLLEAKHKVARLEGPSAYPSAVVIAEALLINCRASESDISSFMQQVLGICQCLFCVFFDVGDHTGCAVAHIYR